MDGAENSFFHMACGAAMFILAVLCLMFGVTGVVKCAQMRQSEFEDNALYETMNIPEEHIVTGEWMMAFVMSEPLVDIKIEWEDGTVNIFPAGSFSVENDEFSEVLLISFTVSYEYEKTGELSAVCFKEC